MAGTIPNEPRMVAIGAPHTTVWDFAVGILAISALGVRVTWLGVDWLFRYPFMRFLGGVPVDRWRSQGLVMEQIERFKSREQYIVGLLPEGSRKKVVPWKRGYDYIAAQARVPILLATLDRRQKLVILGPAFLPTGDLEADTEKHIRPLYAEFLDQYPDQFGM